MKEVTHNVELARYLKQTFCNAYFTDGKKIDGIPIRATDRNVEEIAINKLKYGVIDE